MADLFKETKRNKNFILFEIIVWIIVSVAALFYLKDINLIATLIKTIPEYRNAGHVVWLSALYISQTSYGVLIPVIFGCMILRYAVFENKKQQLIKASFPISMTGESLFELLNGIVPILLMFFIRNILSLLGSYTVAVNTVNQRNHFHVMDFLYQIDELLLVILIYTILVISKRVASNVCGMLLFFILSSYALTGLYTIITDIFFLQNIKIPTSVIIAVPIMIFSVLTLLLFFIIKKVDISKGGTYYFKSVHIFVIIASGVFSYLFIIEYAKMNFDSINPLMVITSLIVSALISLGIWYLTKSHYKSRA
ncbi:MAG: hypothetical protein K5776_00235 [Lachnospiraceae bacterium]|nr:hypothetical protein [Lachnospiraceae bacterium]